MSVTSFVIHILSIIITTSRIFYPCGHFFDNESLKCCFRSSPATFCDRRDTRTPHPTGVCTLQLCDYWHLFYTLLHSNSVVLLYLYCDCHRNNTRILFAHSTFSFLFLTNCHNITFCTCLIGLHIQCSSYFLRHSIEDDSTVHVDVCSQLKSPTLLPQSTVINRVCVYIF